MIDDDGTPVTDVQVLDRVEAIGAIVVRRGPVEGLDFPTWRRELRRAAKIRGFRIAVNQLDDQAVVISNSDHVVTDERRRAAIESMVVPPGLEPRDPPRHGLRLVSDDPDSVLLSRRRRDPRTHRCPPPRR